MEDFVQVKCLNDYLMELGISVLRRRDKLRWSHDGNSVNKDFQPENCVISWIKVHTESQSLRASANGETILIDSTEKIHFNPPIKTSEFIIDIPDNLRVSFGYITDVDAAI